MHRREAAWLFDRLGKIDPRELSPILNVGSSTREYREVTQPWVQDFLVGPLQGRGVRFIHLDLKEGAGIDISADISDDAELERLKALGARTVLCCNVMDHVPDPGDLARRCAALIPKGGYIAVTVPYSYPHHRDPVDTMFRPRPDEIIALFEGVEVVAREIVEAGSYRDHVRERPWILFRHVLRFPFPFIGLERWKRSMKKLYWLANPYLQSCVILRKTAA